MTFYSEEGSFVNGNAVAGYELYRQNQEEIEKILNDWSNYYNNSSGYSRVIRLHELLHFILYRILVPLTQNGGRDFKAYYIPLMGLIQMAYADFIILKPQPTHNQNDQVQDDTGGSTIPPEQQNSNNSPDPIYYQNDQVQDDTTGYTTQPNLTVTDTTQPTPVLQSDAIENLTPDTPPIPPVTPLELPVTVTAPTIEQSNPLPDLSTLGGSVTVTNPTTGNTYTPESSLQPIKETDQAKQIEDLAEKIKKQKPEIGETIPDNLKNRLPGKKNVL